MNALLAFEWRFHLRQRTTLAAVVMVGVFSALLVNTNFGPKNLFINGPFVIWQSLSLILLTAIFVSAVVSSNAVLRDDASNMAEIIYATPTSPQRLLWVRFAGVWMVVVAVYVVALLVLMLAPHVLHVPVERLGPLRADYYLSALMTFVIPSLTVVTATLFAVTLLTRNTLATLVAGIVLYAVYMMIASVTSSPLMAASKPQSAAAMTTAALADPFGISAYYHQARYWTADLRNTHVISMRGTYLANRVIWLLVAAGVMIGVHRVGLRRKTSSGRRANANARRTRNMTPAVAQPTLAGATEHTAARVGALVGNVRGMLAFRATRSIALMDLRFILLSWPAVALMAVWGALITTELLSATMQTEYGTQLIRTSAILVEAIQQPLLFFGTVVLIFFGPEVIWRARGAHMDQLLDATPTGNGVQYAAHFAALSVLLCVLALEAMGIAIALQAARHEAPVQWSVYASLWVTTIWPLWLFAAMVIFVQTLCSNRYVGMLAALAMACAQHLWTPFGIDHPLLRFAAAPPVVYSDVAGFGAAVWSSVVLLVYWTVFAAMLMFAALALWHRGHPTTLWTRVAAMRRVVPHATLFAVAAICTVGLGSYIAYRTVSHGRYNTPMQVQEWRVAYEKTYGSRIPYSPTVRTIKAAVSIYPTEHRFTVAGEYMVFNETPTAVDTIWLAVRRESDSVVASMNGQPAVLVDSTFGMYAFVPAAPLARGDSAIVAFSFERDESGVRADADQSAIGPQASYVELRRVMPSVGYRWSYMVTDNRVRSTYGLAPIDTSEIFPQELIRAFDLQLSTGDYQTPVASGVLTYERKAGDRTERHYHVVGPVPNVFNLASGRYDVSRTTQGDVSVEVYHMPSHNYNVPRMLRAAERSLAYMTARFSPYPHRVLRIVEVSSAFPSAAFATPGTIYFAEDRGFLTRAPGADGLDLVARRTAHEVAHQWWGHQLAPARAPGNLLMVESFAKYIEQRIVAGIQDESRAAFIREYDHDRYLQGRTGAEGEEPSLLRMGGDDYLYYGKGAIVMAAIRDVVGESHLERTMQSMLPAFDSTSHVVTAPEFLRRLVSGVTPHDSALVHEWLAAVTLYDLAIDSAIVVAAPAAGSDSAALVSSGEAHSGSVSRLRVYVSAQKVVRDGRNERVVPMDEIIEVAVAAVAPDAQGDQPRYVGRHRITSGANILEIGIPSPVASMQVTIDPSFLRIDRERTNNSVRVTGR